MAANEAEGERENRFAHLLKPIRDLAKNWDINIANELEHYLEELEAISISFDGAARLNFAEAATLIQGSTCVYSRKVEYLYELIWKTLDEVHLISKDRRRKGKQQSSLREGIDQDALELADTELLLLDDVIKEGGGAVDLLEPHDAFAAIATVASASRHGSTPGRAAASARKGAASTSADLMARTPLSRMGSARSDAGGGTAAFRLGSCHMDDGSGALMMGGQGGAGLLGVAGGSLGLGHDGGMGPGDLRPLGGGSAGGGAGAGAGMSRGGALNGPGGIVGALSFMDGSATGASPATVRTAHFGGGDLQEMGGGMEAGAGGFAEYGGDHHDGGWFGAEQGEGAAGAWSGAGGFEGAVAGSRRRKQVRGLAALWAAAAANEDAADGDGDEAGSADPSAEAVARDDPWLQLQLEDETDSVLRQARSAGVKGVARASKARPLRPARTTSAPKNAVMVASSGVDENGGVRIPASAVAALGPLGAIGSAGVMGSAAALSARLASALGVPVDVSEIAAAPALPELHGYYAAARAAVARARLARAADPASRRGVASSSAAGAAAAAAAASAGGRVLAGADDEDDDDAEAEAAFDAGDDGDFGGDLQEMGGGMEAGAGGFAEYGGDGSFGGASGGEASDSGEGVLSARAALFGPGAAGFGSPSRGRGVGYSASSGAGAGAAAAAGSYEAMVARYRDEFLRSADEEVGTTDMARRVSAWTESVGRALEEEERRGVFDVQAYGRGVMGALVASRPPARGEEEQEEEEEEAEVEVDFGAMLRLGGDFVPTAEGDEELGLGGGSHDPDAADDDDDDDEAGEGGGHVVKGLGAGPPQVARSFLALLQLANAGNVELVHPEDAGAAAAGGACAELRVRLLHAGSATAHLDHMGEVAGRAATTKAAMAQATTPPKAKRGRARRGRRDEEEEEGYEEEAVSVAGAVEGAAAAGTSRAAAAAHAAVPSSGGRGRKTGRLHGDTPDAKRTSSRRGAVVFEEEPRQPALLAMGASDASSAVAVKASRTASTTSVRSTKRPLAPLSQAEASSRLGRKASAASAVSAAASLLAQGDSDSEADSSDDDMASPEAKAPRVRGSRRAAVRASKV